MKTLSVFVALILFAACRSSTKVSAVDKSEFASRNESEQSYAKIDSLSVETSVSETEDTEEFTYRRGYYPPAAGDTAAVPALEFESWTRKNAKRKSDAATAVAGVNSVIADSKSVKMKKSKIDTKVLHDSRSDFRLIQGSEFLWVILGAGAVLSVIILAVWKKRKG
jgi:hypothetical protein